MGRGIPRRPGNRNSVRLESRRYGSKIPVVKAREGSWGEIGDSGADPNPASRPPTARELGISRAQRAGRPRQTPRMQALNERPGNARIPPPTARFRSLNHVGIFNSATGLRRLHARNPPHAMGGGGAGGWRGAGSYRLCPLSLRMWKTEINVPV